ncbi:MAG TPA: transglycosylase SLT domain-containing protein [Thermoanaerobaculia bacterium]|nr:transglycosylase SLT domain-containing protein [Thermoanaerobaculia bacterium]
MGEGESIGLKTRRRWIVPAAVALLIVIAGSIAFFVSRREVRIEKARGPVPVEIEAPPDLAKFRTQFAAGVEAAGKKDHAQAIAQLSSFSFGPRAVEQYRLYHLANSLQLAGRPDDARRTFASLWHKNPSMVYRQEVAVALASLYSGVANWRGAAWVQSTATGSDRNAQAVARRAWIDSAFYQGDPVAMVEASHAVVVEHPDSPHVATAAAVLRGMASRSQSDPLPMSPVDHLLRVRALIQANDPKSALDELASVDSGALSPSLQEEAVLHRGVALHHLRRFEESNRVLEPKLRGTYKWAVPAVYFQAKNYQALSRSINPIETRVVVENRPLAAAVRAAPVKRGVTKKGPVRKPPPGKPAAKKPGAKKPPAKAVVKKSAPKKAPAKKPAGKKAVPKKKKAETFTRTADATAVRTELNLVESKSARPASSVYRHASFRSYNSAMAEAGEIWLVADRKKQPVRKPKPGVAKRSAAPARKGKRPATVTKGQRAANPVAKGRRPVAAPRVVTVKKNVPVTNLALLYKRESYEKLWVERLKDLLLLPAETSIKIEALNTLIGIAEAKKQDAYEQELLTQLAKLEPSTEAGLQKFWNKGWAAYVRGDLASARPLFAFVRDTYQNPNLKRQCDYWLARTLDRAGDKGAAGAIYSRLAAAPYEDLYSVYSQRRGARKPVLGGNPLKSSSPDWSEIAEKEMPAELRLGHELSALGVRRDAQIEIERNSNAANRKYSNALMGEILYHENAFEDAVRAFRIAWPELATVEQDRVPAHFIRMYYPVKYEAPIRKHAAKQQLDPYLVMALIRQESSFNTHAKSHVGATGLMQLMPATGRELGTRIHGLFTNSRLENPEVNIELGTHYLRKLINLLDGNVELAVAGYNGGPYRIKKWRQQNRAKPLDEFLEGLSLSETRNYVKRVTMLRSTYQRLHL